jgi:hypothetical protein
LGATSAVGQLGFLVGIDRVSVAGEGLFLEKSGDFGLG